MRTLAVGAGVLGVWLIVGSQPADPIRAPLPQVQEPPAVTAAVLHPASLAPATLNEVVARYCQVCHNDQLLTGNLSLTGFDVERAPEKAETAERMIRKLRAGMM